MPDVDKDSYNALQGESPKAPSRRFSAGYPRGPNGPMYPSPARLDHVRHRRPEAPEDAREVDVEQAVPALVVELGRGPVAGDRGGLFHSSGALLPFLFAAAPIGLDALIGWIAAWHRTWNAAAARSVFGASMLGLAVVLSVGLWRSRVIGSDLANPVWNQASQVYQSIGLWLSDRGAAGSIVMVNDPPDFFYQTHIQAIVIPDGDVTTLLAAADRFGAGWLILDENHARGLDDFYAGRETHPRLTRVTDFGSTIVYQIRR